MAKGVPILSRDTAWRRNLDGHPGLVVRVKSPSLLQLEGALDLATRDLLKHVLSELDACELHLDVAALGFADAAGLGVLAGVDGRWRCRGTGRVVLHRARPMLERTVSAAGLERLLPAPEQDHQETAHWRERAACSDAPIGMFFEQSDPLPARQLCWACPVTGDCLSYALRTLQAFGIWGGLTAPERALLVGEGAMNAEWRST